MSMYRGRVPYVDPDNPQSWGKDDYTGLPVMHPDMIKQMEYIGNGLAWTGFMVHHKDADQPNPQRIPPRLKVDPVPIPNPRYLVLEDLPIIPSGLTITATTSTSISVSWTPVAGIPAYVVSWISNRISGETRSITASNYTISGLTPANSYFIQVASTADNSSAKASEFSTSAFSSSVYTTLPDF